MNARPTQSQVQAALRKTTETLAAELGTPTDMPPDWSDVEWCIAEAVAAMHGISALLSQTLRWRGPGHWEAFLQQQREHTYQRHLRLDELLYDLDARAITANLAFVPLKGAALHRLGLYRAGDRPMADIDLLIADRDRAAMTRLLQDAGFSESLVTWRHVVFEALGSQRVADIGEHRSNPLKIELHSRIAERLPLVEADITQAIRQVEADRGANCYPSLAALMAHLLLHAAGNMCGSGLRIVQLHDIALLCARMTDADWHVLMEVPWAGMQAGNWWMWSPLQCLSEYYPYSVPRKVMDVLDAQQLGLRKLLRRRYPICDVSLSMLVPRAFPGIAWSGSMGELCRYVALRIRPDAESLAIRRATVDKHPGAAVDRWVHLSQGSRMLRWLFLRPPRMLTISSVNAALARFDAMT